MRKTRILLIASYDSFLKSGFAVASKLAHDKLDIYIHKAKENILSNKQALEYGINIDDIRFFHLDEYFDNEMYLNYEYVVLSIGNGQLKRFFYKQQYFDERNIKRPLIITLFPGVIFGDLKSISARMVSDLILYNDKYDYEIGKRISKKYDFACTNFLYGFQSDAISEINEQIPVKQKKIYFIDQVKIPETLEERKTLLIKFISLAKRYPFKNFVILSRVDGEDITVHPNPFPYDKLCENITIPDNLEITRKPLIQAFKEMEFCLSISSTVLFEAIIRDIPVGVIADLGIKPEYQNKYFLNSNLLVILDSLDLSKKPVPNRKWIDEFITDSSEKTDELQLKLTTLIKTRHNYKVYKKLCNSQMRFHEQFFRKTKKLFRNPKSFFKDSKISQLIRF